MLGKLGKIGKNKLEFIEEGTDKLPAKSKA